MLKLRAKEIDLEESLGDRPAEDQQLMEIPLGDNPFFYMGAAALFFSVIFAARIFYLNFVDGGFYAYRAEANAAIRKNTPAPRGVIYDRDGAVLADSEPVFTAILNSKEFLRNPDLQKDTVSVAESVFGLDEERVWEMIKESSENEFVYPVVLASDLNREQVVLIEGLNMPTIGIEKDFRRIYDNGSAFAHIIGYVGRVLVEDLENDRGLEGKDVIGKGGVELYYEKELRGKKGLMGVRRDAVGNILGEEIKEEGVAGSDLRLTVDKEFQEYFYYRLRDGLAALGRRSGVGLAIDPRNGEILALISLPSFDNNIFAGPGRNREKTEILNSSDKPLFNRAISGLYNPGSTIKPLVAVAALKEGVISSERELFSVGYLDIPNPYFPGEFTRYNDWRYQGRVDVSSAIARSSNVYFYAVGGGLPAGVDRDVLAGGGYISGLGINRLQEWWNFFLLGQKTGVDMPGEGAGFLPSPEWKKENVGGDWLLGDTYNVSIGQGDLLITSLQLVDYISAIANGGIIWKPRVNKNTRPEFLADITRFSPEIEEVRKGMGEGVTSPMGTSYLLHDIGFSAGAKTGTVQISGGARENALFTGFAPFDKPEIVILVLVENAVSGSLNTVPIAKDVLSWYYWNRINK